MIANEFVMTDFFAADCGHCQNFAPVWSEAAESSHTDAVWKTSECYGPGWKEGADFAACKEQNVNSFPTVKLLHYSLDGKVDHSWDFSGPRTAQALEDFATQKIADYQGGDIAARCVQGLPFIGIARQSLLSSFL